MALRFQIDHLAHVVLGVAEGPLTLKDLIHFSLGMDKNNTASYAKLVDVVGGTALLSEADMAAFRDRIQSLPKDRAHGPLALVTSEEHGPLARLFAETTSAERPVKVFKSIHDARKWLREQRR